MKKMGLQISDRGVLTLSKAVWETLGGVENVTVTADRRYGSITIEPGGKNSLFSRKGRTSPQVSLGTALRELGIKQVVAGRREIGHANDSLTIWPTRIIDE